MYWTFPGTVGQGGDPFCGFSGSNARQANRPDPTRTKGADSGFTLLEAIITVAIVAIVVTVAIPGLTSTVSNARRTSAANDLVTAAHLARSTAIRRGQQVIICPDEGPRTCSGSGNWNNGWLVFVNTDFDWPPRLNSNDPVLLRHGPPNRLLINSNRSFFAFHRIGLRSTNGTLTLCDRRGPAHGRAVIISYTGRPRVSNRRPDGLALDCF